MLALALALLFTAGSSAAQGNSGLKGKPDDNPAQTRKYLLSLGWGDDYATDAVVEAAYEWGGNTAMIRVVPMTHANEVSWQSALGQGAPPGNGYFVAKIYNLEDKAIGPLGLGRLGTGYLWIGEVPGSQGERGAAIYSVKNNGTIEGNPKKLTLGGFCAGQHFDSRVELTDGKKCPGPFAPMSRSSSVIPRISFASMTNTEAWAGKGLWVTCLGGCCEVVIT
jgi:hypothetical protein